MGNENDYLYRAMLEDDIIAPESTTKLVEEKEFTESTEEYLLKAIKLAIPYLPIGSKNKTTQKDIKEINKLVKLATEQGITLEATKKAQQTIAGIVWEKRYSTTEADDKFGRWMRIGRINEMTVAIITKAIHLEKIKYVLRLPNNKSDESLQSDIITNSEGEAMLEAEKFIAGYVANFRKMEVNN